MDMNTYALEILARDRLERARAEAAVHALLKKPGARAPRMGARVRLGLALISLGRWLREDEVQGELARG
jgi:hypothetical protein